MKNTKNISKAQISYMIDVEDIPGEVSFLLDNCRSDEIYHRFSEIQTNLNAHNNIAEALKNIESLRQYMVKVDTRLNDCYNILVGYQKVLADNLDNEAMSAGDDVEHDDIEHDDNRVEDEGEVEIKT